FSFVQVELSTISEKVVLESFQVDIQGFPITWYWFYIVSFFLWVLGVYGHFERSLGAILGWNLRIWRIGI
ncbi:37569_t:CDS:2, partial [Gigaspora margarita]